MELSYRLADLKAETERNPSGPAAQMLACGRIERENVLVDEIVQKDLLDKFQPRRQWLYNVAQLRAMARLYPEGYAKFVLSRGTIEGDTLILNQRDHRELRQKFETPPPKMPPRRPAQMPSRPPIPTLEAMAANFTVAVADWAKAGFKVVPSDEYERRHAVCLSCEFWLPDARLGMGKCKKCGCSRVKLWLATSRCPDKPPRW